MPFSSLTAGQRITVLLELLGGPRYAAQMRMAAAETGLLGRTTNVTGKEMALASRRTWLMNQALYTTRRYAFWATVALGGAALGIIKLGYSYLSSMQTAQKALSPVIKSQSTLNHYLNELFQISKYSPFVIKDLAVAFRTMFAGMRGAGVSAPLVLRTIKSLTDALAYTGKVGPGSLNRVAVALQHMAFQGRLTGYTVLQLARDGIPIYDILNKRLGVTGDQLHSIAALGIKPITVLRAINEYLATTPGYKGAALRMSLQTLPGLFQVLKDSISQLSGAFLGSGYHGFQNFLYNIVKPGGPLDKLTNVGVHKGGAAAILYLSKQITGRSGLGQGFLLILDIVRNIGRVLAHVIVPAFVIGLHSLILFYPALLLIDNILIFVNKHANIFKWILAALAVRFIMVEATLITLVGGFKLFNLLTFGAGRTIIILISGLKRLIPLLWAMIAPLLANPITWIVLGVAAIVAGLVILYFKWKAFHNAVNDTFNWIRNHSLIIKAALMVTFWPIILAAEGLKYIVEHASKIADSTKKGSSFFHRITNLGTPLPGFHAMGGVVGSPVVVGERGPELAYMPTGTRIIPTQSVTSALSMDRSMNDGRPIIVKLYLDRRQIAEAVARENQDQLARR